MSPTEKRRVDEAVDAAVRAAREAILGYRQRIRDAVDPELRASIIRRQAERVTQMIEQRIELCRAAGLAAGGGAGAHRFRNARRRLRAARAAHIARNDVGDQQILQRPDSGFDVVWHAASKPLSTAEDAISGPGATHRLSGADN